MAQAPPGWLLPSLHYAYPTAVFTYFVVTTTIAACTLQTLSAASKAKHTRSRAVVYLLLIFVLLYVGQLVLKVVQASVGSEWPSQDTVVGLLSCILVFGIEQSTLDDATDVVWYPYIGSWSIAAVLEPTIAVLSILDQRRRLHIAGAPNPELFLAIDVAIVAVRYLLLLAVILLYFLGRQKTGTGKNGSDEETSPLLPKPGMTPGNADETSDSGYGSANNSEDNTNATNSPTDPESPWERGQRLAREQVDKRLQSEGSWIAYAKGFLIFAPYIWPVHNRRLQVSAGLVGVCLIAGNALNVLIPRQMGIVLDALNGTSGRNPWIEVLVFAALRLAASEAGIQLIRSMLWLPVEYYGEEAISVAAYNHVMNLSADFHDSKSSSDLILAISHGSSISRMLESVCFDAVPMMVDLVVAFVYLSIKFGPYEGFITIATGIAFVQAATHLIARFSEKRKKMVKTYFEEHYVKQAGIQGWHTVSAFNQIPYEETRYQGAIKGEMSAAKGLHAGYLISHAFQYLILLCGLIAGAFLAVYQVTHGQSTAGDFVMLLTYWGQLTAPLRFFSNLGKNISQELVYAERLLGVMLEKPTIIDKLDAKPLNLKGAEIEFRNVDFGYDKKKHILKSVNLTVPPGKTAAFVGATGAGKSTILRLLDRFYEVTGGSIIIDGQDIRDVKLASLRQSIGIVPQAPILFDDTVMNNVRYARLNATDEDVYEACRAAAIHDNIVKFSEGYQTRVGERGIKISGGELQRIAIARAILKKPDLVLLDEATSSVDTETEQKIQEGLRVLCEARTTFIVAHRLSTVMNADIIFVVSEGEIVEQGAHEELLDKKGKYSELWSKQIFVKPKEPKNACATNDATAAQLSDTQTEETPNKSSPTNDTVSKNHTTAGTSDTGTAAADKTTPNAGSNRLASKPKIVTTPPAQTPNGHKKEGSRLNPGAPEFTPRSPAIAQDSFSSTAGERNKRVVEHCDKASPTRSNWADDVETHVVPALVGRKEPAEPVKENTKPAEQSPKQIAVVAYRHFEPQDVARSVSDPVPTTPKKSNGLTQSKASPEEQVSMTSNTILQSKMNSADQPSPRGRGRGARGRGRGGRVHGGFRRGTRSASNPQKATK
ncbi:heavy metal tolerance protein [Seiridium cupressi]